MRVITTSDEEDVDTGAPHQEQQLDRLRAIMGNNIRKLKKDEIEKHYEIKEKLGTGSFAVVKRATRKKDGQDYAIKIIKTTLADMKEQPT